MPVYDCYWYDPKFDTHSCKLEERVGVCPCEGCTKYVSRVEAYLVMKEYSDKKSKSNTSELKSCPFCGTKVEMRKVPIDGYSGCFEFKVRCPKCGCTVDYLKNNTVYHTEEEAINNVITAWNERKDETVVTPQPKIGHWIHLKHNKGKCSECHDVVLIAQMYGNANYCPNCGAEMAESQAESEKSWKIEK